MKLLVEKDSPPNINKEFFITQKYFYAEYEVKK